MSEKQKTMNGYRQKMRKYLKWARQNAQELYEEVWGTLQTNGAVTPDDLTMVPSEVLIAEHDKLKGPFQEFVQKGKEEKREKVVSVVSGPEPTSVPKESQLQRQQVEERASKLLARIEDEATQGDVSEEILTALLVNNLSEIPVQALKSMVDVLERELDEAEREAKATKHAEVNARMQALVDEDRVADTGELSEIAPQPPVQPEEVLVAVPAVPLIPPTVTKISGGDEPRQRYKRVEWEDCPGKGNPWCMGRKKVGYKHCAGCHEHEKEAELRVQQEAEWEDVQCELLAELELKAEDLGLLTPGVKGHITKLLNDETKGIRAAIDYLTAKVDPEVAVVVEIEVNLPAVETKVLEVEDPVAEEGLCFCWHCCKNKPIYTFSVFEDRYSWLPTGHDILDWVGKEICGDSIRQLDRTARRLADASKVDKCPRCKESVSRANRKRFAIRHLIPKDHPLRQWEGKRLCWGCVNELAREVYEASQKLAVNAATDSSPTPTMSEVAWAALLESDENGPMQRKLDEPLVDKIKVSVRQPQRVTQRVTAGAVA